MTDPDDTLTRIHARLQGANVAELMRRTGLAYMTLKDIKRGVVTDPKWSTIQALARYYRVAPDDILAKIHARLQTANIADVSRKTDLAQTTCKDIQKGVITDPKWSTVKALARYFRLKV